MAMNDSAYNQRVYDMTRRVPEGRVTSYGAIAAALGDPRKAREVGWALHANPRDDPAPAHRVVNKEGKLSGGWAFGSVEVQRGLLEAEGVTFLPDGRVDMARHFWEPGDDSDEAPVDEGMERLF
jgi:methylated-DNA-protein-cysteine methyltransferase-like protein